MGKYVVKSTVDHDGERFAIGDPIELTDKQAEPLLDCGAVAPAAETDSPEVVPEKKGKK